MTDEQIVEPASTWKNWAIGALLLFSGAMLYWHTTKSKTISLEISGTQVTMIVIILGALIWYFAPRPKKTLPEVGEVLEEIRNWTAKRHYPAPDTSEFWNIRSSDFEEFVYLPNDGMTYVYNADKGIMERHRADLLTTMEIVQGFNIISKYFQTSREREKVTQQLEGQGYVVNE